MTVHAQVDGVGTLEFPDGTDPTVIHATVQKMIAQKGSGGAAAAGPAPMPTWRDKLAEGAKTYGKAVAGPIEAGESLLTGAIATPLAGIAGVAQGAKNLVTGSGTPAADRVAQVQDALTYQPRTDLGKATVESAGAPFKALAEVGDVAGRKTAEVTGSPALGAGVNTLLQAAPSALIPELAGKGPLGARIAARGKPPAPRIEPTIGEQPGAPALSTPARQTAEQRAQAYVRDRVGVDWDSLSAGIREQITKVAQDPGSLDKLSPEVIARKARLEAAGMRSTRGQQERSLSQLTKEDSLTKSAVGKDIQEAKSQQDARLHQLTDNLRKETGAKAETREQVGKSVQDTGLRAKLRSSKANYDRLYKVARNTEPDATVSSDPMYEFVRGNPEVLNPAIQHLSWLQGWLKKAGIESEVPKALGDEATAGNEAATETQRRGLKLTELDDLRKKALSIAKGGGDNAHYAGEVIKAIDASFEEIPAAAKAWKEAREAFKAHKTEFDEQGIIKKLATDKSRTDRRAALEDTVDTVLKGSSEDIGKIRSSLLEPSARAAGEGNAIGEQTRGAGVQAWKDIQGGVIDKLKEKAMGKREIGNEQGVKQFNSAFRDLFNELDKDGKIDALFSPEQARRLRDINQLVEDVRTTPSGRVAGSDTVPKLISMLDKVGDLPGADLLAKVPGVGPVGHAIVKGVRKIHEAGEEGRAAMRARSDPLEEVVQGAQKNIRGRRNKRAAAAAAPIIPATIGEQLKNEQRN